MFARASSRSHVCLQCQHRLALRERIQSFRDQSANHSHRRWQSSITAVAQGEGLDEVDGPNYAQGRNPRQDASRERTTKYRHWRPPPTAELGVDVLGQPAEILVLPQNATRQRRHRRQDEDQDYENEVGVAAATQDKPQLSIREVLAQESKPASPAEVVGNIDKLREEMDESRNPSSQESRRKYRTMLMSGFTKGQLKRYIRTKQNTAPKTDSKSNVMGFTLSNPPPSKGVLAKLIVERLWGYADPSEPWVATHTSKTLRFSHESYRVLLSAGVIGSCRNGNPKATIEQKDSENAFEIAGPHVVVKNIADHLEAKASEIVSENISIPKAFREYFAGLQAEPQTGSQSNVFYARLENIIQKRRLALKVRGKSQIQAFALSERQIELFKKDLIMEQLGSVATTMSEPLSLSPLPRSSVATLYNLPPSHPVLTDDESFLWHRCVTGESSGGNASHANASEPNETLSLAVTDQLQMIIQQPPTSLTDEQVAFTSVVDGLRPSFSIELGHAVFQQPHVHDAGSNSGDPPASNHAFFNTQIPMLHHFLAEPRSLSPESPISQLQDIASANARLQEIMLYPENPRAAPAIQIYAAQNDMKDVRSLKILEVNIISPGPTKLLALPSLTTDLCFKREDKYNMYRTGQAIDKRFAPFLANLARDLVRADGETKVIDDSHWSAVVELDMSCFYESLDTSTQGQIMEKRKEKIKRRLKGMLYAVDRQYVARAVYDLLHLQKHSEDQDNRPLFLEHLAYTRPPQLFLPSREVWRLVERPLLHYPAHALADGDTAAAPSLQEEAEIAESKGNSTIGYEAAQFKAFVGASYAFVQALDRFISERTQALVKRRMERK